jgi:UPF0755 protein
MKPANYSVNGKRSKLLKLFIVTAAVFVVAIIGGAIAVRNYYYQSLKPVSASNHNQSFTVSNGASVQEISTSLDSAGLIRAAWAFEWYIRNEGLREYLLAGTYNLRPSMSVQEIADVLTQGRIATDLVTIPPGARLDQIRQILIQKYGFSETDVDAALNPSNYANHPALVDKPKGASLEGYLYPESFQKTGETSPETIIRQSLDEMQKVLTPDLRAKIVRQGLTVHQGVILASIIEQEVSNPEDKSVVAQVFIKRLKEDIRLESDATATYGAVLSGKIDTMSRQQVLSFESDYNTYTHNGLTPTPISNVSAKSLGAVASPSNSDYLYFVSGDDGKTYFSRTIEEHEALTAEHCKTLCQ